MRHIKTPGLREPTVKITPAMRQWCARLQNRELCQIVRSPAHGTFGVLGPANCAKPSQENLDKLIDAGLIRFVATGMFEVATLTNAGEKVANE